MIYKLLATVLICGIGAGLVFVFVGRLRQLLRIRREGQPVTNTKLANLITASAICFVVAFLALTAVWTR